MGTTANNNVASSSGSAGTAATLAATRDSAATVRARRARLRGNRANGNDIATKNADTSRTADSTAAGKGTGVSMRDLAVARNSFVARNATAIRNAARVRGGTSTARATPARGNLTVINGGAATYVAPTSQAAAAGNALAGGRTVTGLGVARSTKAAPTAGTDRTRAGDQGARTASDRVRNTSVAKTAPAARIAAADHSDRAPSGERSTRAAGTRVAGTRAERSTRAERGTRADAGTATTRHALGVRAAVTTFDAPNAIAPVARLRNLPATVASVVVAQRTLLLAIACVVASVVILYPPLRDWYVAYRRGVALEAYYDTITSENVDIERDVERLQTREGIEDEARRRGYVGAGETAVRVVNLPANEDAADEDAAAADAAAADATTPLPQTSAPVVQETPSVGMRLLDFVFGYEATS